MAKVVFGLGFVISLAILAIAMTGEPSAGGVEAHESLMRDTAAHTLAQAHCSTHEVALDEGYGVSRKVMQRTCPVAD
ncbi:MAG TPA: hypothetical protein VIJ06_07815 [Methylovirgula sp.]